MTQNPAWLATTASRSDTSKKPTTTKNTKTKTQAMKLQGMTAHELREAAQGLREFVQLGRDERYVAEYKRGTSTIPAHLKTYRISLDYEIQLFREIAQLEERAKVLDEIESYEAENRTRNAGQAPDERTESALSARVFVSKIKSLP